MRLASSRPIAPTGRGGPKTFGVTGDQPMARAPQRGIVHLLPHRSSPWLTPQPAFGVIATQYGQTAGRQGVRLFGQIDQIVTQRPGSERQIDDQDRLVTPMRSCLARQATGQAKTYQMTDQPTEIELPTVSARCGAERPPTGMAHSTV